MTDLSIILLVLSSFVVLPALLVALLSLVPVFVPELEETTEGAVESYPLKALFMLWVADLYCEGLMLWDRTSKAKPDPWGEELDRLLERVL